MRTLAALVLFPAVLLLASPSGPCGPSAPSAEASAVPASPGLPQVDCNGNGVEDAVDIALGDSVDANYDGVPDECQGGSSAAGEPR